MVVGGTAHAGIKLCSPRGTSQLASSKQSVVECDPPFL